MKIALTDSENIEVLSSQVETDPLAPVRASLAETGEKKVFVVPSEAYKEKLSKAGIKSVLVTDKITDTLATQLKSVTDTVVITGLVEKPLYEAANLLIKSGLIVKVVVPMRPKEVKTKK